MAEKRNNWKNPIGVKLDKSKQGLSWQWPRIKIDRSVAYLHYRLTVLLLVGTATFLTWKQLFGETIQCLSVGNNENMNSFADMYCLFHSTYTVPNIHPGAAPHPGVGPARLPINPGEVNYHRSYLWVNIVLFLLGILFYLPKYIWKECESGQIKMLIDELPRESLDVNYEKMSKIRQYFIAHRGFNNIYFCCHLMSELFYLLNVIGQIIFLDNFLGNELSVYGKQVFEFTNKDPEERVDAIEAMFPKVTKCTMEKYGPSGNSVKHDFICLLPLNVFYEKILIWICCWFLFLAVLTFLSVGFWILYVLIPHLRFHFLLTPHCPTWIRPVLQPELTFGDIFLLYVLKWNLQIRDYEFLLVSITLQLDDIQLMRVLDKFGNNISHGLTQEELTKIAAAAIRRT